MTRATRQLLVLNAGSSSLKFEVFAGDGASRSLARGAINDIGAESVLLLRGRDRREVLVDVRTPAAAAEALMRRIDSGALGPEIDLERLSASAHRVVHGGGVFTSPVLATEEVMRQLNALSALAPLHNPASLGVMEVVRSFLPQRAIVAVFDTTFFRALPETARLYAIPQDWQASFGIERYGFHGIAHEYLARRVQERSGRDPARLLTLQLGRGCSITALAHGRPVETSMGFTPLEGLIMGTRCGDIDAGVLLHLLRQGFWPAQLDEALSRNSGLLGLSGASGDVRELLELEAKGHAGAARALAAFCHRVGKYAGAYAAVLQGVDAIAFGGGIGEHAPSIRARICEYLSWLGLELDAAANDAAVGTEALISTASSPIEAYCIPVHEEAVIARAAFAHLEGVREESR